uniref:TEA domain transcription factor 4 n=1 Tax=Bos taurus TaxID=9913 RepID=A0AAA9TEH2_BOVIN
MQAGAGRREAAESPCGEGTCGRAELLCAGPRTGVPALIPRIPGFLLSNPRPGAGRTRSSRLRRAAASPSALARLSGPQRSRSWKSRGAGSAYPPTSSHPGTGPTGAPPSGALEGKAGTITSNEWGSPNSPEGSNVSGGSQALDKPIDNDAEGVWSPDIEQSFQEALAIYPPCGRRKIILSDEGKMYGRNELIARYIKLRTGKTRTRKQVSSHIQVLARRKAREIQAKLKDQAAKDKALQSMAAMSSAQIISAAAFHSKMTLTRGPGYPAVSGFWQGALPGQAGTSHDVKPFSQQTYTVQPSLPLPGFESPAGPAPSPSAPPAPPWQGRSVASSKLWMLEFSAFLERQQDPDTYNKHLFVHIGQSSPSYSDPYLEAVDIHQIYDKFPEKKGGLKELFERGPSNAFFLVKFWADLNTNMEDEGSSFYGVSSQYESPENMIITCSTKVCSFGKQVVEKVETEYARYENGHYSYRIHRSPLCEYMINFIHKLKHLPEKYMMNSVLENFTILQVVTNRDTQETLLCVAYVFEVSASEHGAQHHIYRLVKE